DPPSFVQRRCRPQRGPQRRLGLMPPRRERLLRFLAVRVLLGVELRDPALDALAILRAQGRQALGYLVQQSRIGLTQPELALPGLARRAAEHLPQLRRIATFDLARRQSRDSCEVPHKDDTGGATDDEPPTVACEGERRDGLLVGAPGVTA